MNKDQHETTKEFFMSSNHSSIILNINNKYLEFDVEYDYEPLQRGDFEQEHIPESFDILNLTHANSPVGSSNSLIDRFKCDIIKQIKDSFFDY